jgi:hypothetical protein
VACRKINSLTEEMYGYGEEFKEETVSEASNKGVGSKAESEISILERFQQMNLIQEKIWSGPFSPLNERVGLAHGVTGDIECGTTDDHMETVKSLSQTMRQMSQGDIPDWVGMLYRNQQAPAPPVLPKYKGRTKRDRLEFMRAYETYLLELENQRRSGFSPYVAPIASCIEEGTLRDLADFYFMKSPIYITEDEWAKYFLDARLPEENFYSVRKSFEEDVENNLRLKLTYGDAESCLAIYRRDLDTLLEKHNLYFLCGWKTLKG